MRDGGMLQTGTQSRLAPGGRTTTVSHARQGERNGGTVADTETEKATASTLVIVPTYNEVENLPLIVARVRESNPDVDILVVDDNSPDGTGDKANELAPEERRWRRPCGAAGDLRGKLLWRLYKSPGFNSGLPALRHLDETKVNGGSFSCEYDESCSLTPTGPAQVGSSPRAALASTSRRVTA